MSDKYGYIGLETLLEFCSNQKDHCVTPNDFMRMNRVKIDERPHREWKPLGEPDDLCTHSWYFCSNCSFRTTWHMVDIFHFCPNCGADMRGEKN